MIKIWSMKKEAAGEGGGSGGGGGGEKRKPKATSAQIRVQKGDYYQVGMLMKERGGSRFIRT